MDRQPDDITMLLVGQTGHGKSATGNSILGKKAFLSKHSPGSVTGDIKRDVALRKRRRIEIVDSPGFADTSKGTEFVQENLMQAVYQTLPGFNAIVFVLNRDRFTDELVKTVNLFFEFFGIGVDKFAFILFTHTKSKERMNEYIDNAVAKPSGNVRVLLHLIERCGSKVMYIDNKNKERKQVMVDEIIRTIDENRERVGQEYFTNKIFERARHEADRYIEENNPTKPLEINNANETVKMRSKTTSDDNKSEKNNKHENISVRIHKLFNRQALLKPKETENRRKIREDVERLREERGIKFQDLRNRFESYSRQTDISQIRPDVSKRFTHQHVKTTQQKHTQQPAYETVAQNQSALEQNGRFENNYKPAITSQCSGEFYEDPNKQLHDELTLVHDDQKYLTGSDEYRPAPGRKYDEFKKKVINDKNFFESLFEAFKNWLKNL